MTYRVVSSKPKFGRIFILTIGSGANQIVIKDLYETGVTARRVSFNITSALGDYTQGATIQIYNLSPEEVQRVTKVKLPVVLQAGYKEVHGDTPPVIYQGNAQYPNSQRSGTDIVTTLVCFAYRDELVSIPKLSFEQGTKLTTIFSALSIVDNTGKKIPYQIIGDNLKSVTIPDDYTSGSDNVQKVMNHFAVNYNFLWWCDTITKQLMIVEQGEPLQKNEVILVNSDTGLIKEPELTFNGIAFETSLEPTFRFQQRVQIEYPRGVADFQIETKSAYLREVKSALVALNQITHTGDTRGDEWKTSVQAIWLRDANNNIISL
jgi:hypothetical protein